jgi:hypothetical protein
MKDNSLSRLGGVCSILVGISYIVAGVSYLLMPAEQTALGDPAAFLSSYAQDPTMSTLNDWAFALGAILALAAVLAISERVRSLHEGWVRWTSTLALVGFAVTAIHYFRNMALYPGRAAAYVAGDAATKAAIAANQSMMDLDPNGWLMYGGIGLWLLVVNLLALRGNNWPKPLAYVGFAGAIGYWFVVTGYVLQIETLVAIAAAAAVLLGPIWYIWAGLVLRRAGP